MEEERMHEGVVVVTGAANGIGAAILAELRASGRVVVGVDRQPASGVDDVEWIVGDVADGATHDRAVAAATALGVLDGWVNNAGIIESVPLHLISDAEATKTLQTNLYGTLAGTRAALTSYLGAGVAGAIVNVSSIHGRGAFPGSPAYDASKGGIEALTRYAAVEYGKLGIRVNAVAPGAIRTELLSKAIAAADDPARLEAEFAALHPLERLGEPAEVARAVRFLLSPDASFISGTVIPVDGGSAARVYAFPPHSAVPDQQVITTKPEEAG
jgi:NAD(P)-dependent dehydrogenase (short-subunit alcohol dehydrogenase family)